MKRLLQLCAFLLIPGLNAVTPLIAIPAITSTNGTQGWEAYALGLSIGSAGAVVVELGWPLTGPQRVAAQAPGQRWLTMVSSLRTRLLAFLLVAPAIMGLAVLLARHAQISHVTTASLMALASVTVGLSGNWFFIGIRQPLRILTSEALPRATLITVAAFAVLAGAPLETVPLAYLLSAIISPVVSFFMIRSNREAPARFTLAQDLRVIQTQFSAMGARSIAALYTALPITLVGIFAPSALATFAAAERLMRMGLTMLQAVPNMLQNWLGSATSRDERRYRATRSILINGGVGVFSGVVLAVAMPVVTPVLFTGTVEIEWRVAALTGVVVVLMCISRASGGLALVAYQRVSALTLSTSAGAVVGLPAICGLAYIAGAEGAFVGEIMAGVTVVIIELLILRAAIRADHAPRRAVQRRAHPRRAFEPGDEQPRRAVQGRLPARRALPDPR